MLSLECGACCANRQVERSRFQKASLYTRTGRAAGSKPCCASPTADKLLRLIQHSPQAESALTRTDAQEEPAEKGKCRTHSHTAGGNGKGRGQPLWTTAWKLPQMVKHDTATPLLCIYPREMKTGVQAKTCMLMFTAAFFITAVTAVTFFITAS